MKTGLTTTLFFFLCWIASHADFEQGLEAYENGRYDEAIEAFNAAVEENETPATRHNLALAYFQNGEPGEAAWQLERALRLDPKNESYYYKLGAVRQQLGLPLIRPDWKQLLVDFFSQQTWIILCAICIWTFLAALLLPKFAGSRYHLATRGLILLAFTGMTLAGFALIAAKDRHRQGVCLSDTPAELHAAPAHAAPQSGLARPGERVQLIERHQAYAKIRTEAGAEGWIHQDRFRLLQPPG